LGVSESKRRVQTLRPADPVSEARKGRANNFLVPNLSTVASDPNIEELTELFALSDWYRSPLPKDMQNTLIA